jgi:Protein of unknown function (DUF1553)/Protein of unknown function (DUF1549)/Planctomycete cytochrome C
MESVRRITALTLLFLWTSSLSVSADDSAHHEFFERTIRPLLAKRCLSCHGTNKPKGGLSLTSRASILAGGRRGAAVVPGNPGDSLLVEALSHDSEPRMPPKARLAEPEIQALTQWVELGLPWPESADQAPLQAAILGAKPIVDRAKHWAFQPLGQVLPPDLPGDSESRNPIDRLIRARLRDLGLTPSPQADRATLIRRLTFDLTGLPPTPSEVAAFKNDQRPDAYERLVDRLLASPNYGEQWGRHWLDIARYSDTKGYVYAREEAQWVHAWVYRDWVVRALNEDMPYNKFLLLQIAADQVSDNPADLAAMGFLTLGRRFLGVTHDIIDDRIDVVTRGTLGLTVACARCHDHKYDPIPTADYYALYGVFRNCSDQLVRASEAQSGALADSTFEKGLRERQDKLNTTLANERAAASNQVRKRVIDYLLAQFELHKYPEEGFDQILVSEDLFPAFVRRWRDALDRALESNDPIFKTWHDFSRLPADQFASRAAELSQVIQSSSATDVNPLIARSFFKPPANHREVAERYGQVLTQIIMEWEAALSNAAAERQPPPTRLPDPAAEAIRLWLYNPDSPCEVPDEPIVNIESFFPTDTTVALWKLQGDVDRWIIQAPDAQPHAAILVDRKPTIDSRIFRRGDPANLGDEVPRRFLQVLSSPDAPSFQNGSGRLELVNAIIDPANPLTARVMVNRVWMHHFGAGLVRSPGDFGARAEPPSHPELLDWLTSRFIADGWSLKSLHRLIVTSATYQQSTTGPVENRARALGEDPQNRWLGRMQPHHLTFEELRDAILSVTGELDQRLGGKPVNLVKPPYSARRTLYGLTDRQDFPSLLRTFDVANPDLLIPQRSETTVPQQALFFLNDPFILERAHVLVERPEIVNAPTDEERIRRLFDLIGHREPTTHQIEAALALICDSEREPQPRPSATATAWSYGYGRYDGDSGKLTDFQPLPHFNGIAWQGGVAWPDASLGWAQLTPDGGHPGNDLDHAVVRRWTAPREGQIQIRSTLVHEVSVGDGIRGFLVSSRQGTLLKEQVHNTKVAFDRDALEVKSGDTIDFIVDIRDELNSDQFLWTPILTMADSVEPSYWQAEADFSGPAIKRPDGWDQLAQVLLMSNEFTFVD